MKRENFQSRLGFILVSAGCAIGIGNVWRFPYVTGQSGGAVFVLFYLLFLILLGAPVMSMELAVGRAGRQSARNAYWALEPEGTQWHAHGWFCMAGCVILMMYYTSVSGWMTAYFWKFLTGQMTPGMDDAAIAGTFSGLISDLPQMIIWMGITVGLGFLICSFGLQKGVEAVSKYMMSALLILIVILAVHSISLPDSMEGLKFYLLPDWKRAQDVGIGKVIMAAMNQSFFTLSLGTGAMEIFGSYMSEEKTLRSESRLIIALDTFVALVSGLIIFPACSSFHIDVNQGPALIFITLPNVFLHMQAGRLWGTLFFLFMTFASFSTVIAVFENLIANGMDNYGWSRKKSSMFWCILIFALSLPCVFGYSIWADFAIAGKGILDLEDFVVSNLLLPIGSLVFTLFCTSKKGWGFDRYLAEANHGKGTKTPAWIRLWYSYGIPALTIVILVFGLIS